MGKVLYVYVNGVKRAIDVKTLARKYVKLHEETLKIIDDSKSALAENEKLREENEKLREENESLTEENGSLRDAVTLQGQRIKGEVAICEFNKRCLESAESALHEKDSKIAELCRTVDELLKAKKKLKKELREKRRIVGVLNGEIEFQYKRRAKAECLLNAVDSALDVMKENVKEYGSLE